MKRVLVAADLTPRSVGALERGLLLAGQIGAEVHVLHVVDADLPATIAEPQQAEATRQLQEWLAASPHAAGVTVSVEAVLGHRVADVLAATDAAEVELVVLGAHRKSPLKDVFVGGTADQLIRLSKRPVLVVPDSPAAPYQRMLAAVDFSDSSRQAVEYAATLLPKIPLELLHVYTMSYTGLANLDQGAADSEKTKHHLRHMIADDDKRFLAALKAPNAPQQVTLRAGNVLSTIPEEVARQGADLLVIGTQGRRGIARAVLGSVAAKLTRNPVCDVLVVR